MFTTKNIDNPHGFKYEIEPSEHFLRKYTDTYYDQSYDFNSGAVLHSNLLCFFFVIALIIWAATCLFDRRLKWLHMFTSFWASLYVWMMPAWKLSISGREKIFPGKTYVIVSNHQSQLDILVAFGLFFPFKWVSKAEIFRVPFVGWNMTLNRYIKIRRGDKQSIKTMLKDCEKAIAKGSSVFFFPEGTRSKNGRLGTFKLGAFSLAHKMRVPLLLIAINGTKEALPKYSMNFHGRHAIHLEVLGEIPYEDFANLSVEETAQTTKNRIASHIKEEPAPMRPKEGHLGNNPIR